MLVSGAVAEKPSRLVAASEPIELRHRPPFVSRGGTKLEGALDRFGVDPAGRRCLDVGASTGGFTDCLLQRGAASVVAVDVGRRQLDHGLRDDERVTVMEGVNARKLTPGQVGTPPTLVTADVSFISLATVAPALAAVATADADFVLLVKPQFEAGPEAVERGGVVREPDIHRQVVARVVDDLAGVGLATRAVAPSSLRGPAGNVEFFVHAVRGPTMTVGPAEIEAAVAEAHRMVARAQTE